MTLATTTNSISTPTKVPITIKTTSTGLSVSSELFSLLVVVVVVLVVEFVVVFVIWTSTTVVRVNVEAAFVSFVKVVFPLKDSVILVLVVVTVMLLRPVFVSTVADRPDHPHRS